MKLSQTADGGRRCGVADVALSAHPPLRSRRSASPCRTCRRTSSTRSSSVSKSYAKEKGIEVIVVDAKNDTATQVSQVQDLMTQGIDAFIYIPAGAAAAAVPTRLAREAGIPVINVDRVPDGAPGDTFIAGESVESAYAVCKHIIEKAGGKGKMAIIHGQKGTTPEVDRFTGCKRAIDENPGVELVDQQWSEHVVGGRRLLDRAEHAAGKPGHHDHLRPGRRPGHGRSQGRGRCQPLRQGHHRRL